MQLYTQNYKVQTGMN